MFRLSWFQRREAVPAPEHAPEHAPEPVPVPPPLQAEFVETPGTEWVNFVIDTEGRPVQISAMQPSPEVVFTMNPPHPEILLGATIPVPASITKQTSQRLLEQTLYDDLPYIEPGHRLFPSHWPISASTTHPSLARLTGTDSIHIFDNDAGMREVRSPGATTLFAHGQDVVVCALQGGEVQCLRVSDSALLKSWRHDAPIVRLQSHGAQTLSQDTLGRATFYDSEDRTFVTRAIPDTQLMALHGGWGVFSHASGKLSCWDAKNDAYHQLTLPSLVTITAVQTDGRSIFVACDNGWMARWPLDGNGQGVIRVLTAAATHLHVTEDTLRSIDAQGHLTSWHIAGGDLRPTQTVRLKMNSGSKFWLRCDGLIRDDGHGHYLLQRYTAFDANFHLGQRLLGWTQRNPQKASMLASLAASAINRGAVGCVRRQRRLAITAQIKASTVAGKKDLKQFLQNVEATSDILAEAAVTDTDLANCLVLQSFIDAQDRSPELFRSRLDVVRHESLSTPEGRAHICALLLPKLPEALHLERLGLPQDKVPDLTRPGMLKALASYTLCYYEGRDGSYKTFKHLPTAECASAWAKEARERIKDVSFSNTPVGRFKAIMAQGLQELFKDNSRLGHTAVLRSAYKDMAQGHGPRLYWPISDEGLSSDAQISKEYEHLVASRAMSAAFERGVTPQSKDFSATAKNLTWGCKRLTGEFGFKAVLGTASRQELVEALQAQTRQGSCFSFSSDMDLSCPELYHPRMEPVTELTSAQVFDNLCRHAARDLAVEWASILPFDPDEHDSASQAQAAATYVSACAYREPLKAMKPTGGNIQLVANGAFRPPTDTPMEKIKAYVRQRSTIQPDEWLPSNHERFKLGKALRMHTHDDTKLDVHEMLDKRKKVDRALVDPRLARKVERVTMDIKAASWAHHHPGLAQRYGEETRHFQRHEAARAAGVPEHVLTENRAAWRTFEHGTQALARPVSEALKTDTIGTVAITVIQKDDGYAFLVASNNPVKRMDAKGKFKPAADVTGFSPAEADLIKRSLERHLVGERISKEPVQVVNLSDAYIDIKRRLNFDQYAETLASYKNLHKNRAALEPGTSEVSPQRLQHLQQRFKDKTYDVGRIMALSSGEALPVDSILGRYWQKDSQKDDFAQGFRTSHKVMEHSLHAEMQTLQMAKRSGKVLATIVSKLPCGDCRGAMNSENVPYTTLANSPKRAVKQWNAGEPLDVKIGFTIKLDLPKIPTKLVAAPGPFAEGVHAAFVGEGPLKLRPARHYGRSVRRLDGRWERFTSADRVKQLAKVGAEAAASASRQYVRDLKRRQWSRGPSQLRESVNAAINGYQGPAASHLVKKPAIAKLDGDDFCGRTVGRLAETASATIQAAGGIVRASASAPSACAMASASVFDGVSASAGASLLSASANASGLSVGIDLSAQLGASLSLSGFEVSVPFFGIRFGTKFGITLFGVSAHLDLARLVFDLDQLSRVVVEDSGYISHFDYSLVSLNPNHDWQYVAPALEPAPGDASSRLLVVVKSRRLPK